MIEFITQNKSVVIIAIVALLVFNNRESLSFLWRWIPGLFSFLKFSGKSKTASPDDRKDLYECLIQLQDYLAICGVEREKMDNLTLAEVGKLTVSATTPLKPSFSGDTKFNKAPINTKIPV